MTTFTESIVEDAALAWLARLGYAVLHGPARSPARRLESSTHTRRPDVVLFVNGLPLAVIELKNSAAENATVWSAFQQLQTYQAQVPALFATNAVLIASDGVQARIGCLAAGKEWFKPWRTITGRADAPAQQPELQVVLEGVCEQRRFLDLVRHFIVFEDSAAAGGGGGKLVKERSGGAAGATSSRRARSRSFWSSRCAGTRTAPSRPRKSSRS